jgi:hypothetical protein
VREIEAFQAEPICEWAIAAFVADLLRDVEKIPIGPLEFAPLS